MLKDFRMSALEMKIAERASIRIALSELTKRGVASSEIDDLKNKYWRVTKEIENMRNPKCPRCDQPIHGYPALSRKDNETEICSDCGIAESLEEMLKM